MKTTTAHQNRSSHSSFLVILIGTLLGVFSPLFGETASLSFSETYQRNLLCTKVTKKCKDLNADKFSAVFEIPLTNVQSAGVNQDTVIEVRLGAVQFKQMLGSAYLPDTRTATIVTKARNAVGRVAGTRTLKVQVLADKIVCNVEASTSDLKGVKWKSVVAGDGAARKAGKFKKSFPATIRIGESSYSFSVNSSGTVKVKKVKGKDGKTHSLPTVSLKGSGSLAVNIEILPVLVAIGTDSPLGVFTADTAGGSFSIASGPLTGVSITVPPGALSSGTQFIVASNNSQMTPRTGTFSGSSLSIQSDRQTSFAEPIAIGVPYDPAGLTIPVPYYVTEDGKLRHCQIRGIDRVGKTLIFETFHVSIFTWIDALVNDENPGGHTSFLPGSDGFQIVNRKSDYNPFGECFGMAAFAQWHFSEKGGGLFQKYHDPDILYKGSMLRGQQVIATRAHTSVHRRLSEYLSNENTSLSGNEMFAEITNVLSQTASPTMLDLTNDDGDVGHVVLAYDHVGGRTLLINDPNDPGVIKTGVLSLFGNMSYDGWQKIVLMGNGSFKTEDFENIYEDAEAHFNGTGHAQIDIESHTDGQNVTERTIRLAGKVSSGMVLVDRLIVTLNGTVDFEVAVGSSGSFDVPINLVSGRNEFTFATTGTDFRGNRTLQLNDQVAPFSVTLDTPLSQVLVTLTWNTDDTDIDLYTIDPTGDYSAYFNKITTDGGELDYDDTSGYGPEHWTLENTDNVRWGQEYDVRVHYYGDHAPGTVPTRWNVSVLLYEGTPRVVNYNFSGVLTVDSSSNKAFDSTGPDWADVCTFVPVQATAAGALVAPRMETAAGKRPRLIIPIPDEEECLRLKAASRGN